MVRLTDRPDMTLDVYSGRKTTTTTINENKQGDSLRDDAIWPFFLPSAASLGSRFDVFDIGRWKGVTVGKGLAYYDTE